MLRVLHYSASLLLNFSRLFQNWWLHATIIILSVYEPLTISPVAAQCNGACDKRSSIECVHIDRCWLQKSWRWRLRSTLNLDSDKFRCFNHRDELDNTVFLPKFRLVTLLQSRAGQPLVTIMCAIYSTRLAYLSMALRKPRKHVKFN